MLKSSIHSDHQPRLRQSSPKSYHFDLECLPVAMPEFSGKDVIQSFTMDQLVQKEHCHLYRFIRFGGLGTNEKFWYQRDFQKTIFVRTVNRIDREI